MKTRDERFERYLALLSKGRSRRSG